MRIGLIGINHKLAPLSLRELLAKTCEKRFGSKTLAHLESPFVLLSTCNRTEVYFSSDNLAAAHSYLLNTLRLDVEDDFDQKVYSYFGEDCFLHLARVTSGLDSAILCETEIQGQVKKAYESSLERQRLPLDLHYLFQKSLKIGKEVRSKLPLERGTPDLSHAIFSVGLHAIKQLETAKVLFIGASEINEKIIRFLKSKNICNITVCNRSLKQAKELAQTQHLSILPWDDLEKWPSYDWIIFGTKSPDYLISKENTPPAFENQKLIMDLSVPRNVDPSLGQNPKITLLNIDQLNRILRARNTQIQELLFKAEQMVLCSAKMQTALFKEKEKSRFKILAVTA